MAQICEKVRFSIDFDRDTETPDKKVKYYDLFNTHRNCKVLLAWCKQLNLLSFKVITEIKGTTLTNHCRFKKVHEKIQEKLNNSDSQKTKTILGNILINLILTDEFNLIEYLEEVKSEEHLEICEIRMSDKLGTTNSVVPVYSMKRKNRGVLFFVNIRHFPQHKNTSRSGSEQDKFYLISLFRKFGYKIYYYEDLLLSTFWVLVDRLIKVHLIDTESLIFVVASHGNENQEIEFYHGETTVISDILFQFSNLNCPQMEGKPKIFIFPCCRGQTQDHGVIQFEGGLRAHPTFSDILICYATIHGFVTNRDIDFGSWYIEAFYRVLAQQAYEMDIESMLYLVNNTVKSICDLSMEYKIKDDPKFKIIFQTPSCVRWDFNKLLYFNPGYVEEF